MTKHMKMALVVLCMLMGCGKSDSPVPEVPKTDMYFPAGATVAWETTAQASLGWNQSALQPLKDFLSAKHTRAFIILVNGRIVMEEYFNGHTANAEWEWNSAGKTLVSAMTGVAQQEGLLDLNSRASRYLGTGWTNMPLEKENLINVRHLLTMTSGIDDSKQLVVRPNLTYVADAGGRWAYGNVFQKLTDVVAGASGREFETYFNDKLKNRIGMDGRWNFGAIYTIYHSTARSMARFGLLALNGGKWKDQEVINAGFFGESVRSSQAINPAYGYLWWLNGKERFMIPGEQTVFQGALVPSAPSDMYAAMGASDQRIYVVPSRQMVVVRMGEASDPTNPNFAVSGFDEALWNRIAALIR